jgi:hypothetical protein
MSIEYELSNLYDDLEIAQASLARAQADYTACQLNRPGFCQHEADRVQRARKAVHGLEKRIAKLEKEPASE